MLIPSCTVVERTVTGCGGKLKALVASKKALALERKGGKFFLADREMGQMDYTSLRWRGKSSSRSEFRRDNDLAVQVFQNSSVQP